MDFAQERVTTLHDLEGYVPDAPLDEACVVVPLTGHECGSPATEHVFSTLEAVDPGRVLVALRAGPDRATECADWLRAFALDVDVLWCTAGPVHALLADHELDGEAGKGRDLWLALGLAAEHPYVVCHDADASSYSGAYVPRLLAPLADGFSSVKGYYARVEGGRFYGRLYRLLYAPLVQALREDSRAGILEFLAAFRYALAGEFAMSGDLARDVRVERRFGLEVGLLGEAFELVGAEYTAQVDLGRYEHDHRGVAGPGGLADMSRDVAASLFRVVAEHGVAPDYETVADGYRRVARRYVGQYAADARANGLDYDAAAEREQVDAYAGAIQPPGTDTRLPPWSDVALDPADVLVASRRALDEKR